MRLYSVRPGGAPQNLVRLPHLVLLPVPFRMRVIFLLVALNFYLALCIGGNFWAIWSIVRWMFGNQCFRSYRTTPPLPAGSNTNCPGWSVAIAAEWWSFCLVVGNRPRHAVCFGRCSSSRHMRVEAPSNLCTKFTMGFRVAAAMTLIPITCCNFFLYMGVFSWISSVVVLSVLSTTLAIIFSWLISSWFVDIVGAALLGDVTLVPISWFILFIYFQFEFRLRLHIVMHL